MLRVRKRPRAPVLLYSGRLGFTSSTGLRLRVSAPVSELLCPTPRRHLPTCTAQRHKPAGPHTAPAPSQSPSGLPVQSNSSRTNHTPTRSLLLLNLVTLLWGTQHAVIKLAVADMPPAALNLSRFLLAALVSLPALPAMSRAALSTYRVGAELALYLFAGYALQSISLLTTSAARSGFLLYLNVKLVPIFARVLYGRQISGLTWRSAALALFGTGLLTYDGSPPALGDLWSVLAAAASALFILRLEKAADHPPEQINAIALTSVAALCALWSAATSGITSVQDLTAIIPHTSAGVGSVLYLGLVITAFSNYLQTIGQRDVPAERAAVIFAMDPVYGAFFAYAILGESLGLQGIIGAALIAFAALLSNRDVASHVSGGIERNAVSITDSDAKGEDFSTRK